MPTTKTKVFYSPGSTKLMKKFRSNLPAPGVSPPVQCTDVHFASFLSGGFTTMAVINQLERKLAKRTSVYCIEWP